MRFIVPFAPQSAMRPNYSSETGRPSHMFMPKTYRKWRDETNLWFEDWLFDTDYRLLKECLYLDDGRIRLSDIRGLAKVPFLVSCVPVHERRCRLAETWRRTACAPQLGSPICHNHCSKSLVR